MSGGDEDGARDVVWSFEEYVTPPDVPRDRAPRNYAEQRALLDNSLQDIALYSDEVQAAEPVAWWRLGEEGSDAQTS